MNRSSQLIKGVIRYALVNGLANSLMHFQFCGVFFVGGMLLRRGEITSLELWRYILLIIFQAQNWIG